MKVDCSVEDIEKDGDESDVGVPSVCITCGRCDHSVEVFGQSMRSVRRGLVMLRDECPESESNYYSVDEEQEESRGE
jgi:hypothetical protein